MRNAVLLLSSLWLVSCAMGPDYQRPTASIPETYHGSGDGLQWKEAEPRETLPKENWWTLFGDAQLNSLEQEALSANQNLKAAFSRVEQARSLARVSRAEFFPQLDVNAAANRSRISENVPNPPASPQLTANNFSIPVDLSYEIDLWGKVRREFESARAQAQESFADYQNVLLALQSDVAQNYFALRSTDAELELLARGVKIREEALRIAKARFDKGQTSELDAARAKAELDATRAEELSLRQQRSELVHALAILLGKNAGEFQFASAPLDVQPPKIPVGLPSELLERRPDVAAAERRLVANNAKIGVAQTAFFPVVRLTGSLGVKSDDLGNLFTAGSSTWSLGPSIQFPLFEGGRNKANLDRNRAAYEEAVALYRQQILVAFKEVEDALVATDLLGQRNKARLEAATAAARAADISDKRYQGGAVSYLEVLDSQRVLLENQRSEVQLRGLRMVNAVRLIKALGGGWQNPYMNHAEVAGK